jgi:hypothetical protein
MALTIVLWWLQAAAYVQRRDWGHALMCFSYGTATCGLVWAWYRA